MLQFSGILLKFVFLLLGIEDGQNFPPPLKENEEKELFEKLARGESDARGRLIEHNLRLVSHIIRKYYGSYPYPDDLISIGSLGLIKAVDTFKIDRGIRFATYGARCVQNEILMFFRSQKKLGLEISINETIDIDREGNPLTYLDIISHEESMDDLIEKRNYEKRIRELVDRVLPKREKEIIVLRYGLEGFEPRTQREVAKHLGISRSYVSRIEKRALEKLKEAFGEAKPIFDD